MCLCHLQRNFDRNLIHVRFIIFDETRKNGNAEHLKFQFYFIINSRIFTPYLLSIYHACLHYVQLPPSDAQQNEHIRMP